MEKNKNTKYNYEVYAIIVIIVVAFIILFSFASISEKKIYELKKLDNGNYNITGFVSDLKISDKYTTFKLNDNTDSINIIANYKIIDLNEGIQTTIICNLQTNQYGKVCYINSN